MFRIIRTTRLDKLENLASALPMARSKCDGLETDLGAERRRAERLEGELAQAKAQFQQEQETTARAHEERLAAAGRSAHLNDQLLSKAQQQARTAEEKVRELKGEIERLKAKLAANPVPDPEGVVARFLNMVGSPVDVTLYATALSDSGWRRAELKLVLLCAGCGYTQEESRYGYGDDDERQQFVTGDYEGGKLKRWAQEHAEKCRAVALPVPYRADETAGTRRAVPLS